MDRSANRVSLWPLALVPFAIAWTLLVVAPGGGPLALQVVLQACGLGGLMAPEGSQARAYFTGGALGILVAVALTS